MKKDKEKEESISLTQAKHSKSTIKRLKIGLINLLNEIIS